MKITPVQTNQSQYINISETKGKNIPIYCSASNHKKIDSQYYASNYAPSFGYFYHESKENKNLTYKSSFYRGIESLWDANKEIKEQFPEGTDILNFACSNGEETISLYSLLNDTDNKYKIHAFDNHGFPLEYAKKGVYGLHTYELSDGWLLKEPIIIEDNPFIQMVEPDENHIRECFYNVMEEVEKPNYPIFRKIEDEYIDLLLKDKLNGDTDVQDFQVKYFKLKDQYKKNLTFEQADIKEMDKIMPEKQVGAIFFRNAFYHVIKNLIHDKPESIPDINRKEIIEDIVDKIYDKLLPGGIFVMGESEEDNIILANSTTPPDEIYSKPYMKNKIYKKSPIHAALRKDGRFVSIDQKTRGRSDNDDKIITVWKKVG